jgi:hypothetical protein
VAIPRVAHFVFGLRPQDEPFHLLHYLAIESCRRVVAPDEIVIHLDQLPYGVYWDLARPLVTVDRIRPVAGISTAGAAGYEYAHQSDVVRLDVLAAEGGLYADIDTVFCSPFPDDLWIGPAVIGVEADVQYEDAPHPEASVSNALLMAEPGARFITEWRRRIVAAMDGSWSGHSCRLATRLTRELPEEIRVEPQHRFHAVDHTPGGIAALLEKPYVHEMFAGAWSVHTCAHLWWESGRTDISTCSALDITEEHVRTADTALAQLARPFLPAHGLW